MKALFVELPGKLWLADLDKPAPNRGEVLVKMKASGICGTDIEKVRGHGITSKVLGHEVVGEIAQLGEGVSGLTVGERVFTHHHTACLSCSVCRSGEFTLCPDFGRSNIVPGGFAEYYIVPEWNVTRGAVVRLPDSLDYKDASVIEPLACCARGLRKVEAGSVSGALIYGAGPVGLLHLKLLRNYGVSRVDLADVSDYRLDFGRRMGAGTGFNVSSSAGRTSLLERPESDKPDLVVVATGNPAAFEDALTAVARGGDVLLFGAPSRGSIIELDAAALFLRGVNILTSYSATEKEVIQAIEMMASGILDVSDLITHVFPLSESVAAFDTAQQQRCMKAVVTD